MITIEYTQRFKASVEESVYNDAYAEDGNETNWNVLSDEEKKTYIMEFETECGDEYKKDAKEIGSVTDVLITL